MPTISIFYGIIVYMFYVDNKQHTAPHIHAEYQGQNVVLSIPEGEIIAMNPTVLKVKPEHDYVLSVWFSNGEKRRFDMKPYLDYEMFRALKDRKVFISATPFLGGVGWSNNADLSYDTLYLESAPVAN